MGGLGAGKGISHAGIWGGGFQTAGTAGARAPSRKVRGIEAR